MRSNKLWIPGVIIAALPGLAVAQQIGIPAASLPSIMQGVGIDQNLNAQIPLELQFKDENGQVVRLGQYFREKPVVLALVYYECPGLCDLILNGLTHSMEQISLNVGSDYEVVTVSFLTGDEASIKSLADTVGFHYRYDPISKQYAHASAIYVITPEGKIARYFFGIEYKPRDLRLGLVEASANKIGTTADQVLLFCYHYDPTTGKYGMAITAVTRALGTATVLLLGGFVFIMLRRERQSRPDARRSA